MLNLRGAVFLLLCSVPLNAQTSDPGKLFQQATAAQHSGDNSTAIRIYRELLASHPDSVELHANLGLALASSKQYNAAIEQYRVVLAAQPKNVRVRLNLALAYRQKGDLRHAASELELVHKQDPADRQAQVLLAECYYRLDRYADVISILEPLETVLPDDLDVAWMLGSAMIRTGYAEQGLQRVDRVAEQGHSADAYLLAGQSRLGRTEYDLARSDAEHALKINPALPGAQTLWGMSLEQSGDYDAAENALRAALTQDPNDFDAHYYLGAIFYFRRDLLNARTELEAALRLRSDSSDARYELALVSRAEGKLDDALSNLEAVEKQNPDWLKPHIELSSLYFQLKRPEDGARERQIVERLQAAQEQSAQPANR
jgi:tetratricopeptide (TPR) repeat protein